MFTGFTVESDILLGRWHYKTVVVTSSQNSGNTLIFLIPPTSPQQTAQYTLDTV